VPDRRHCPGTLLRLVHRGRSTPDGVLDVHLPCDHAVVTIFSVHIFPGRCTVRIDACFLSFVFM
jgi:hypothetical protein